MRPIALFLALATLVSADPVALKLKLAKGKTWKVEQSVSLTSKAGDAKKHSNGAVVSTGKRTPFVLTEKWTDVCVEDKGGEPQKVRRTIAFSRCSTGKVALGPTLQEGCVLLFERADKKCSLKVEKGKPDDLTVKILKRAPVDIVEMLLPDHDVSEGDTWEVGTLMVSDFMLVAVVGLTGAQGPAKNELREDIRHMDPSDNPMDMGSATSSATIVNATLKSVKDKVATIEFLGDFDPTEKLGGKAIPNMPEGTTKFTGTFTLNVETGTPIKVEWKEKHVQEPMQTDTGEVPGMTEDWTLTRTYGK
jgi:hypothetical protein